MVQYYTREHERPLLVHTTELKVYYYINIKWSQLHLLVVTTYNQSVFPRY